MSSASKIAIVGVGQVGGAVANAIILTSLANEVLLVETEFSRRASQVQDLADVAFSRKEDTAVRAASYKEAAQSDIIIITAGSKHFIGQPSMDYTDRNISIVRGIMKEMSPFRSDAIIIVVANPVDLLTSIVQELSGLPRHQVLGSGTFLDSVRLRGIVASELKVAASSLDIYVLGVQGESQVTAWSTARLGGSTLTKALPPHSLGFDKIADECRERAQAIMQVKGATPYGIASVVASTCRSILLDKRNVRPLSHFQPEFGCCFSLPALIGRQGVIGTIHLALDDAEDARIRDSARKLKGRLESIKKSVLEDN
uniref:L-lactate dehydrogenase n=1 Tax=Bionectria ochroleuca TaxID=29856 RepID=A0A8H7KD83_BIOOC